MLQTDRNILIYMTNQHFCRRQQMKTAVISYNRLQNCDGYDLEYQNVSLNAVYQREDINM